MFCHTSTGLLTTIQVVVLFYLEIFYCDAWVSYYFTVLHNKCDLAWYNFGKHFFSILTFFCVVKFTSDCCGSCFVYSRERGKKYFIREQSWKTSEWKRRWRICLKTDIKIEPSFFILAKNSVVETLSCKVIYTVSYHRQIYKVYHSSGCVVCRHQGGIRNKQQNKQTLTLYLLLTPRKPQKLIYHLVCPVRPCLLSCLTLFFNVSKEGWRELAVYNVVEVVFVVRVPNRQIFLYTI